MSVQSDEAAGFRGSTHGQASIVLGAIGLVTSFIPAVRFLGAAAGIVAALIGVVGLIRASRGKAGGALPCIGGIVVGLLALGSGLLPELQSMGASAKNDDSVNKVVVTEEAKLKEVRIVVQSGLYGALERYRKVHRTYPNQLEDLAIKPENLTRPDDDVGYWVAYLKYRSLFDPWGKPYQYRFPGGKDPAKFDLWSFGPDGQDGGPDDVVNWDGGIDPKTAEAKDDFDEVAERSRGVVETIEIARWRRAKMDKESEDLSEHIESLDEAFRLMGSDDKD
jgi:hypothetical protein